MGDHLDFSGSVFNEPFVGKSVVHTTQVTAVVPPRMDDKVYVVTRYDWLEGDHESDQRISITAARSLAKANKYVGAWKDPEGYLLPHYEDWLDDTTGKLTRYFRSEEGERMTMTIDILPLV
jgi:hypothetical protein